MTAFISAVFDGDRIEVLSDGATYTSDGYVTALSTKVRPVPNFMAATMTRGDAYAGELLQDIVHDQIFANAKTFDEAMQLLEHLACGEGRPEWDAAVQCVVWGISETKGPMTYWFATKAVYKGDGPWKLMSTSGGFGQGDPIRWGPDWMESGTLADKAVFLMQNLRKEETTDLLTGQAFVGGSNPIIGGHIDLTTITAQGVTQRRLHTWPDRIGEPMVRDPSLVHIPSRIAALSGREILFNAIAASKAGSKCA